MYQMHRVLGPRFYEISSLVVYEISVAKELRNYSVEQLILAMGIKSDILGIVLWSL